MTCDNDVLVVPDQAVTEKPMNADPIFPDAGASSVATMRTPGSTQQLPELSELRNRLKAAGVFEHNELRGWFKLAGFVVVATSALLALAHFGWIAAFVAIPVAAVCSTSIAMMGHEGSHRSFSASPTRNTILNYFAFPLFSGLSTLYWREKHDRLHHGHPNVEGLDPDIRPWPFASSQGDHERSGRIAQWVQRNMQSWAFWPASLLMALGMRRSSLMFVANYPKKRGYDRTWWAEIACLSIHYTAWLVIPSLIWGPLAGFLVYSAVWAMVGSFLALVFLPAHVGLPIVKEQHHDWLHQLETTQDLELPRVVSFFFIGLDYQAEHHLFPKIPHLNLPRAAAITRQWCQEKGVVHLSQPYLKALAGASSFMRHAWSDYEATSIEVRAGLLGQLVPADATRS